MRTMENLGEEMQKIVIGDATLYHADCIDVLPTLGKIDAVVTDPPYGIKEAAGKNKSRGKLAISKDYGIYNWDNNPISDEDMGTIRLAGKWAVIFGGNYYSLPPSSCWLVWDKVNGKSDFADCELAWTNLPKAVRIIRFMWNGMLRDGKETRGYHPTQKPIHVMEWVINHCPQSGVVLDPLMGAGTTGVACMNLGKKFIGIEKERKYFDIACERIEQAQRQLPLIGHNETDDTYAQVQLGYEKK